MIGKGWVVSQAMMSNGVTLCDFKENFALSTLLSQWRKSLVPSPFLNPARDIMARMGNDISYLKIGLLAGGVFAGMLGALRVQDHRAAQWDAVQTPPAMRLVAAEAAPQPDMAVAPVAITPEPIHRPVPEAVDPDIPSPREARIASREQYREETVNALSGNSGIYFRKCDDVRAAGLAPLYRGDPGYREGLDRDNDGIACEPYRGRRR